MGIIQVVTENFKYLHFVFEWRPQNQNKIIFPVFSPYVQPINKLLFQFFVSNYFTTTSKYCFILIINSSQFEKSSERTSVDIFGGKSLRLRRALRR